MFYKLFAERGLSLDRLKAFLAVARAGSIVKAAEGDPIRQSQFSRQIKELEDFFRTNLVERHGKTVRLTPNGRELARISRFFLLGLSNFQRGCQSEEQVFRIGACATWIQLCLLPVLASSQTVKADTKYVMEIVAEDEIERRLHDLTLDFGVTTRATLSRPLHSEKIAEWRLALWVPLEMHKTEKSATSALKEGRLHLAFAARELESCVFDSDVSGSWRLICDNFLQAFEALKQRHLGAILPESLNPNVGSKEFLRVRYDSVSSNEIHFRFAWNPRLLRLNPHAVRSRDFLRKAFT